MECTRFHCSTHTPAGRLWMYQQNTTAIFMSEWICVAQSGIFHMCCAKLPQLAKHSNRIELYSYIHGLVVSHFIYFEFVFFSLSFILLLFIWFSSTSALYCGLHIQKHSVLCAFLPLDLLKLSYFVAVVFLFLSHVLCKYFDLLEMVKGKSSSLTLINGVECYLLLCKCCVVFISFLGLFY